MKNTAYIFFLFFLGLLSCNNEDSLTPSMADRPWSDSLDLNDPRIKNYYENYGIGVLTRFDEVRDLKYNMTSTTVQEEYWNKLLVEKLQRPTEVDSAITFFQKTFFCYFTDKEFIQKYFPKRILLTRELILDAASNNSELAIESDARISALGNNSQHCIFSLSSFAFSVKLSSICYSEENYYNYKMDNLYIFICYLFQEHDLYNEFGDDFYLPEMKNYYGRNFSGPATDETNGLAGVYVEEGGNLADIWAYASWYWEKGFVSTAVLNPVYSFYGYDYVKLRDNAEVFDYWRFPQKEREVRSLINQLLFMDEDTWSKYPDIVKGRFQVLMQKMDEWGIDIRSVNPEIAKIFPRN